MVGSLDDGHIRKQLLLGQEICMPLVLGNGWFQICQDCKQWSEMCSSAIDILAQSRESVTWTTNILPAYELFSVELW